PRADFAALRMEPPMPLTLLVSHETLDEMPFHSPVSRLEPTEYSSDPRLPTADLIFPGTPRTHCATADQRSTTPVRRPDITLRPADSSQLSAPVKMLFTFEGT